MFFSSSGIHLVSELPPCLEWNPGWVAQLVSFNGLSWLFSANLRFPAGRTDVWFAPHDPTGHFSQRLSNGSVWGCISWTFGAFVWVCSSAFTFSCWEERLKIIFRAVKSKALWITLVKLEQTRNRAESLDVSGGLWVRRPVWGWSSLASALLLLSFLRLNPNKSCRPLR